MSTLAAAMLDAARKVTDVVTGVATGGSATTIVDTAFPRRIDGSNTFPPDGRYTGGPIWFLSGNKAGRTAICTAWTQSSKTLTFADPGGGAVAASDRYAVADRDYPVDVLRQGVNDGLRQIEGLLLRYEDAAFLTVFDQHAYTLPNGVYGLRKVELAGSLDSPYDYREVYAWDEIGAQLVFWEGAQPGTSGYRIRLTYLPSPGELTGDTGAISDRILPEYLAWEAALSCLRWKYRVVGRSQPKLAEVLTDAIREAEKAAARFRPRLGLGPRRTHSVSIWALDGDEPDDRLRSTVRLR